MIKATGRTGDGDALLLLGLSRTNCVRLLQDQPIRVVGAEVGMPGLQVVLVGGETEETITAQIQSQGWLPDHPGDGDGTDPGGERRR